MKRPAKRYRVRINGRITGRYQTYGYSWVIARAHTRKGSEAIIDMWVDGTGWSHVWPISGEEIEA